MAKRFRPLIGVIISKLIKKTARNFLATVSVPLSGLLFLNGETCK